MSQTPSKPSNPPPPPQFSRPERGMCGVRGYRQCICGVCGCFDGHCMVSMSDGTKKLIKDVRMGDIVFGGFEVMCVVEYKVTKDTHDLVKLGNLCITPWHPIKVDKDWVYPTDLGGFKYTSSEPVYNLVLNCGHTVDIDGYTCCTLAHKMKGPVIEHPYWGTNSVVNDLMCCDGWMDGFVSRTDQKFERDDNGEVVRMVL